MQEILSRLRADSRVSTLLRTVEKSLTLFDPPNGELKLLNLSLNRMRALGAKQALRCMPSMLAVNEISWCNLQCPQCPTHGTPEWHKFQNGKDRCLSSEIMDRLIGESFQTATLIKTTTHGEPFLSPHLDSILDGCLEHGTPAQVVTNATRLPIEQVAKALVLSDRIVLSIDGVTRYAFEKIRKGAKFDKVLHNICVLVSAANALPEKLRPDLFIRPTVMASNLRELPAFVDFARWLGVPNVCGEFVIETAPHVADENVRLHKPLYNHVAAEATRRAEMHGVRLGFPAPFDGVQPDADFPFAGDRRCITNWPDSYVPEFDADEVNLSVEAIMADAAKLVVASMDYYLKHSWEHERTRIAAGQDDAEIKQTKQLVDSVIANLCDDGKPEIAFCGFVDWGVYVRPDAGVAVCCAGGPVVGSLAEESIEEIWNGKNYQAFREEFYSSSPPAVCQSCRFLRKVPKRLVADSLRYSDD